MLILEQNHHIPLLNTDAAAFKRWDSREEVANLIPVLAGTGCKTIFA